MDTIQIFDGTSTPDFGVTLGEALRDVSRIRPITSVPVPGSYDLHRYEFIQRFVHRNFNRSRGQLHTHNFLMDINNTQLMQRLGQDFKVILLAEDLYADGLNWCFGSYVPVSNGRGYLISSSSRALSKVHLTDILRHEIGHMFGAPSHNRDNVGDNLGLHCLEDLCIMQQKLSVDEAAKYAVRRARANAPAYCSDCMNDIRNFR